MDSGRIANRTGAGTILMVDKHLNCPRRQAHPMPPLDDAFLFCEIGLNCFSVHCSED